MTYYEILKTIKEYSESHPMVNSFFYNKYALVGDESNIDYGVISLLAENHSVGTQASLYRFKIIYADRISDDNNSAQIQSVALDTLREIVNAIALLDNISVSTDLNINTFENQFADRCAGAIADLQISSISNLGECEYYKNKTEICKK